MKPTALRQVSVKRAAQTREYNRIRAFIIASTHGYSEYTGLKATTQELVIHHIDGRRGLRLLDPFNMIVVKQEPEHVELGKCHNYEQIQELKKIVRPIRLAQGFKEAGK
jgi:hypothetical protein